MHRDVGERVGILTIELLNETDEPITLTSIEPRFTDGETVATVTSAAILPIPVGNTEWVYIGGKCDVNDFIHDTFGIDSFTAFEGAVLPSSDRSVALMVCLDIQRTGTVNYSGVDISYELAGAANTVTATSGFSIEVVATQ